jgi:sialic acid synthase SpsE
MFRKNSKYPYIIAEIGANHNGEIDLAKKLVDAAKSAGCDAVKFQLWNEHTAHTKKYMDELSLKKTLDVDNVPLSTPELGLKNAWDQLKKYKFYHNEHIEMKKYCDKVGIDFSSTGMNMPDLEFLKNIGVNFLKIASQDTDNPFFLKKVSEMNLPTIVSTGLCTLAEIDEAVRAFSGNMNNLSLLHTISLYPPKDSVVCLKRIELLKKMYDVPIGYSDHTLGYSISLASVALGATIIEKHFTLDKTMPGWDHKVSADPKEMKIICEESKRIVDSLGTVNRELTPEEIKKREHFRMSIVTVKAIEKGKPVEYSDLWFKRPGTGIRPNKIENIIGRIARVNIPNDKTLSYDDLI